MPIKYKSTRGKQHGLSFEEVVLAGLATDKGLYIPETIPNFSKAEIEKVGGARREDASAQEHKMLTKSSDCVLRDARYRHRAAVCNTSQL
ncbi:threonine synthase N terminus-domain-containing protein [Ochromonadaceae sp. CCMP2298]|nr:threonine synthase N terminus-domain-containing protein [Ochromonadaceae sp. CCMP2298]